MKAQAFKSCCNNAISGIRGSVGPLLPDSIAEIAVDVAYTATSSSSFRSRGRVRAMSTNISRIHQKRIFSNQWLVIDEKLRSCQLPATSAARSMMSSSNSRTPQSIRKFSTVEELDQSLIITNACVKRIKQLQEEQSNPNLHLRVAVNGGGCSGFSYFFEMEDTAVEEDDIVFTKSGCQVVVDTSSFELLQGSTIDFTVEMIRSSFSVRNNPQSESACGCGSSFALKNFASNPALD